MTGDERLRALSDAERRAFCRQVLERFSDLVEGTAPADFCQRVEAVLGDCPPFVAYRNTLATTIDLTRSLRPDATELPGAAGGIDDATLRRCAARVRQRLAAERGD